MSYQTVVKDAIKALHERRNSIVNGLHDAKASLNAIDKRKKAQVTHLRADIERMAAELKNTEEGIHDLDRLDTVLPEIEEINASIDALAARKREIYASVRINGALADSGLRSGSLYSPCDVSVRIGY